MRRCSDGSGQRRSVVGQLFFLKHLHPKPFSNVNACTKKDRPGTVIVFLWLFESGDSDGLWDGCMRRLDSLENHCSAMQPDSVHGRQVRSICDCCIGAGCLAMLNLVQGSKVLGSGFKGSGFKGAGCALRVTRFAIRNT